MAISRRGAFEIIGASALASLLADCGGGQKAPQPASAENAAQPAKAFAAKGIPDTTKAHVNLICHGMMLFWYPWDGSTTHPDYLYILVPRPPGMAASGSSPAMYHHEVALSQYHGGLVGNHLRPPFGDYRRGEYTLDFGGPFTRMSTLLSGPPDSGQNVVLSRKGNQPVPLHPVGKYQEPDPIWFRIQVPYPTFVYTYRPAKYNAPVYLSSSQTIADGVLQNDPTLLTGVNVLYYEAPDHSTKLQITLQPPGSAAENIGLPVGDGAHQNIHLYSQPATWADYDPSHLDAFNKMMTYAKSGVETPVQLMVSNAAMSTAPTPPMQAIDGDLDIFLKGDRGHLMDLAEIFDGPNPEPLKHTQDPVECLQGWGT